MNEKQWSKKHPKELSATFTTSRIKNWTRPRFQQHTLNFECILQQPSIVEYQVGGGKRLTGLVDQLTLECCHSFRFYGSCRKRIPMRDSVRRVTSQVGEKRENHAACRKNWWDKISFQLLNQRSVYSNFNIIQYEKQSASFNHQLYAQICCLGVVECVVGGPIRPNPRWRCRNLTFRIVRCQKNICPSVVLALMCH